VNGDGAARGDGEERPRDERGRLLSRFPKAHIQRAVREVCLYADPAEPLAVSRPLFDACRAKAGWSNLPTAKQCAARMRLTWEQLKAHALADDLDFTRSDGARDRRTRNMFRPDQVPFALKVVHARLAAKAQVAPGEYRLSASAYDMEVIELEASSANSRGLTLLYPTARQVEDLCELPFEQVCRRLGIAYGAHQERSLEVIEVLDMIVETYDVLPTQAELTAFAKANKLSMKNPKRLRDDFARLRAQRDALGKSTPRSQRADKLRPDFTVPVGEYQGRRAKEAMPGADELLAIGVDFVRWIESNDSPRGARPTAPMWRLFMERRVAEGERRIWEPSLAAHYPGGLSALVADAYDELLSEHQREAEPKPVELRSGSVPGDETFDYDAPLIAHLTSKRTTWMLPICAYVHQHGPCRRVDIGESLGLGPTGLIQNVTRLLNLDALRAVSPEGAEDGRTRVTSLGLV
jgi:hypothetical protein